LYAEVPAGGDGIDAVYRRLIGELSPAALATLSVGLSGIATPATTSATRDLRQALKLITSGDAGSRAVGFEWLAAERGTPHLNTLRSYGISGRIESDERTVDVLAELASLWRSATSGGIVLLVDEFQRIADLPQRKRDALLRAVVSLFNSTPLGLHLVLSFSVGQQSVVEALLPGDLRSRANTFPILALPYLTVSDAVTFAQDLFSAFRQGESADRSYPFTSEALEVLVVAIERDVHGRITPRTLMETIGNLLYELVVDSPGPLSLPVDVEQVVAAIGNAA